jgi:hypothetical protein
MVSRPANRILLPIIFGAALVASPPKPVRADPVWGPAERAAVGSGLSSPAAARGSDGRIHVVWKEPWTEPGMTTTRIRYREHDGSSWAEPIHLSATWPNSVSPRVAADEAGQPHAVWLERGQSSSKFLVRYSVRWSGEGWSIPVRVSATERVSIDGRPRIALLPGGEAVVVWCDDDSMGNSEVFWNRCSGGIWLGTAPLSGLDAYHSNGMDLAVVPGGRLAAIWMDRRAAGYQKVIRFYDGKGWGPFLEVGSPSWTEDPRLVADPLSIHIFVPERSGIGVLSGRILENRVVWDAESILPTSLPTPSFDAVPIEGGILVAYGDVAGGDSFIFTRKYGGDPLVFDGIPLLAGSTPKSSSEIALASDPFGSPSVVWTDCPDGGDASILVAALEDMPTHPFLRGDIDGLGLDVADALLVLGYLYEGGSSACLDAVDADDGGFVDLGDAIYILSHLFLDGPPPPSPVSSCGKDVTPDGLSCESSPCPGPRS